MIKGLDSTAYILCTFIAASKILDFDVVESSSVLPPMFAFPLTLPSTITVTQVLTPVRFYAIN